MISVAVHSPNRTIPLVTDPVRLVIAAGLATLAAVADAGSWSAPLSLAVVAGDRGDYLAADFELDLGAGVQLREIESVSVSITLPDGYQLLAYASGYSSVYSSLRIALGEAGDAGIEGDLLALNDFFPSNGPLVRSVSSAPAGQPQEYEVPLRLTLGQICSLTDPPTCTDPPVVDAPPIEWPEGWLEGQGRMAIADVVRSSAISPGGPAGPTTTALRLPTSEVVDASITITGVAVPEPASAALTGLAAGCLSLRRRRGP